MSITAGDIKTFARELKRIKENPRYKECTLSTDKDWLSGKFAIYVPTIDPNDNKVVILLRTRHIYDNVREIVIAIEEVKTLLK